MLDKLIGAVLSNVLGSSNQSSSMVGSILGALINSQGGIEGIFNKLQKGGLGDVLDSWIGTGTNKPLESNQVTEVFGQDTIDNVAQQAGIDRGQAQDIVSQILPQIIDMLTPNGREGGVSAENLVKETQRVQQDDGFDLGDLFGSLLGGSGNNTNPSSHNQGDIGDLLGGLLGGSQNQTEQVQHSQSNPLNDFLNQIANNRMPTSQTSEASNNSDLARDIGSVLNGFFK